MMKAIAVFFEKWGPVVFSLIGGAVYLKYGDLFFSLARDQEWSIFSLYQSVFDTSSIVCAFLFSFLIFIKTTENKFLSAFRSENIYKKMQRHFIISIGASFLLTIFTMPFLVVSPIPTETFGISFFLVMAWAMATFFVIGCTVRSGYQFLSVLDAAYSERFVRP